MRRSTPFKYIAVLSGLFMMSAYSPVSHFSITDPQSTEKDERSAYKNCLSGLVSTELIDVFTERFNQYLPQAGCHIVTLIDFSLPSTEKRLWTVDLETGELLFHALVAHGKNTGEDLAVNFSNTPESYCSSLGFYLTENTYSGKHGNSLRLIGLEQGINDKAMERAIVIHGADYVSESFIAAQGRLGRSHGCPALPLDITDAFIETVKEGSLLFIYHPGYSELLSASAR